MRSRFLAALFAVGLGLGAAGGRGTAAEAGDDSPARWEPDIRAFEAADATNPPPRGAILFIGSSSIRLWKTLAEDFPGHRVVNRGFGGSQIADVAFFADRIVTPYAPRQIVFYAGGNDIAGGKSPAQVAADFRGFVEKVRGRLPGVPIVFISIGSSPSRWAHAQQVRETNGLIAEYCRRTPGLVYLNTHPLTLGSDGRPRAELFESDQLHLNREGYKLWRQAIAPCLLLETP